MNKQKICIVGDGLSGLTSAICINQLPNIEVTLIAKKGQKNTDKRTTAISESNFKFLNENVQKLNFKLFWPSKNIKLFYESNEQKINFLNLQEKNTNLMYVFENDKVKDFLSKKIVKSKIKVIRKEIKSLNELKKYDLIILCLGGNSKVYQKIIKNRSIDKDYKEIAMTGHIKHKMDNINTSQYFLKEGPLAILPLSKQHFSFVWSLDKKFGQYDLQKLNEIISNKILTILNFKQKPRITNLSSFPIKLGLKRQYYNDNVLILGEGLHSIHPVAGQGFNLVLRDIKELKKILKYYSELGISIKNSYALSDFYNNRKPENLIMGLGIDATHKFFKSGKNINPFKDVILKSLSDNQILKRFSKIVSNKGLSF